MAHRCQQARLAQTLDALGIEHPVMLAGMGGVSYAEVCAAVSEAGGFGTLGMAGRSPDEIRTQMRRVRQLTKKPFGVDLLAAVPESLERTADIRVRSTAACQSLSDKAS